MRVGEIVVGGLYSNGKEGKSVRFRRVLGEGERYKLYRGQANTDCVGYATFRLGAKDGDLVQVGGVSAEASCTRVSFASWAKARVDDAPASPSSPIPVEIVEEKTP